MRFVRESARHHDGSGDKASGTSPPTQNQYGEKRTSIWNVKKAYELKRGGKGKDRVVVDSKRTRTHLSGLQSTRSALHYTQRHVNIVPKRSYGLSAGECPF